MAKPNRPKKDAQKQVTVTDEFTAKMIQMKQRYGGSHGQVHLQELLQGRPPNLSEAERQLRIEALRQLGYKDLRTDKEREDQRIRDNEREQILKKCNFRP